MKLSPALAIRLLALALLVAFIVAPQSFSGVFAPLTKPGQPPIYTQNTFLDLALEHLAIVFAATLAATIVAVGLAILVTRPAGVEFLALSRSLANIGQTFPPVAVLAVAVPLVGFGELPALIALALYGLLPVMRGTVAGLQSVPPAAIQSATGMGMSPWQRLRQVEIPLALPVWLAGVRTSVIINIGTTAIASTVGAKTLGSPIIVGLSGFNTAYVLQGAVLVGLLAVVTDMAFERLSKLVDWKR